GDTWAKWLIGQTVQQHAPAIVTRGAEIRSVQGTNPLPFVAASQHPNGALAVATLPRSLNRQITPPPAAISLFVGKADVPIGVFGNFESLTLTASQSLRGKRILAQDLATDEAVDVTADVIFGQNEITIPGELITRLGTSANGPSDLSDPGLVIVIEE